MPEEDFHDAELGVSDELHAEVFVSPSQLHAGKYHFLQLHWAFETVKDGIGFGVSFFPSGTGNDEPGFSSGGSSGGGVDDVESECVNALLSDANLQANGKGMFTAAFMELKGSVVTFRDKKGGKEIGLGSAVGAEAVWLTCS